VRLVAHYNCPGTLEAYYQEAGRAGRDGLQSRCILLFSYQDRYTQEFFIDKIGEDNPNSDPRVIDDLKFHARQKLELFIRYAQTHRCRRQMILDYFGDESVAENCKCDVCRQGAALDAREQEAISPPVISDELVILVKQLLSAVARLRGKFGVGVVAEVLAGASNEKTSRWGFDQLSVYGLLKAHSIKRIVAMLHRLMEAGLARQRDPDGVKFRPVIELTPIGVAVMKGEQLPPASLVDLMPRRVVTNESIKVRRIVPEGQEDADAVRNLAPEAADRFEKLRAVRTRIARDKQLPPYCICHDSTLKLIAHFAPTDVEALERVKGMGPYKVRMYGEAFLEAIR